MTRLVPLTSRAWEDRLLRWASAGRTEPHVPVPAAAAPRLQQDYAACAAIAAAHSRSFHLATALLPRGKRQAMRALYAICRLSDDLVDQPGHAAAFDTWRAQVLRPETMPSHPVLRAWADTRTQFGLPQCYVRQMLDGLARDLSPRPLRTFDALAAYAYGVASTVGLMSMYITGFAGPEAIPYAVKLGVALQLTNILRDVGEDCRAGRVYLPQDELAAFGLGEADLAAGRVDDRWRAFMRYQVDRNRLLYAEAWPGLALLHPDGRLAVAAAAAFYRAILDDIEAHDYDVFHRRARVGALSKLLRLPGLWWWSRTLCPPMTS